MANSQHSLIHRFTSHSSRDLKKSHNRSINNNNNAITFIGFKTFAHTHTQTHSLSDGESALAKPIHSHDTQYNSFDILNSILRVLSAYCCELLVIVYYLYIKSIHFLPVYGACIHHRLLSDDAYGIYVFICRMIFFSSFTDIKPECIVRSLEIFIMHDHSCESSSYYYFMHIPPSNTTVGYTFVRIGIHHNIRRRKKRNNNEGDRERAKNISIKMSRER